MAEEVPLELVTSEELLGWFRTTRSLTWVGRTATASTPDEISGKTVNRYDVLPLAGVDSTCVEQSYAGASDIGPPCSACIEERTRGHTSSVEPVVVAEPGATVRVRTSADVPGAKRYTRAP